MWPAAILEKRPFRDSYWAWTMCRKMLQLKLWPVEYGDWGKWSKKEAGQSLCTWITDLSGDLVSPPHNVNFPDKHSCGQLLAAMHMSMFSSCCLSSLSPFVVIAHTGPVYWHGNLAQCLTPLGGKESITNCFSSQGSCCSKESTSVFSTFHYNLSALPRLWDASFKFPNKKIFFISKFPEVPN